MNYPINYPLAKLFSSLGFSLSVRIDVIFDEEARVYVATSKDIAGLVLEADTFQALTLEVQEAVVNLIQLADKPIVHVNADLIYRDPIVIA